MDRLAKFLWLGQGEQPTEYVILRLCRDVYRCLPSEVMEENWAVISLHLAMMNVEKQARR